MLKSTFKKHRAAKGSPSGHSTMEEGKIRHMGSRNAAETTQAVAARVEVNKAAVATYFI